MKIAAKVLFLSLSLGALALPAFGQAEKRQPENQKPRERQPRPDGERPRDGGEGERPRRGPGEGGERRAGGQQLSKEKLEAAWSAQATAAAKRLSLSSEQTSAVVKAYTEARESVRAKIEELNKNRGQGEPGANRDALRELEAASKEKFSKALTDAKVSSENAAKLNATLGNAGTLAGMAWDRMADTLLGMKLEAAKQQSAMNAVEDFVTAQAAMAGKMRDDPEAARESRQKAREDLTKSLKGVLTEEQMKTFEEAMPRGAGMRRPGGPEGERPARRPEGGKPEGGKPEGEKPRK